MSSFVLVYEILSAEELVTGVQLGGARWRSQPSAQSAVSAEPSGESFRSFSRNSLSLLTHSETEECSPHYLLLRAPPLAYAKET